MKRPFADWHSALARRARVGRPCTPVDFSNIDYASFKLLAFGPQGRNSPGEDNSRGI